MDEPVKKDEADEADEDSPSADQHEASAEQKVIIIKSIAPNISHAQLLELVKTVPGFQFLSLSDPNPTKRYYRIGWIMLSEDSDPQAAIEMLEGKSISTSDENSNESEFVVHVGIHSMTRPMKRKFLYPYLSSVDYVKKDLENIKKAAVQFESEFNDPLYSGLDKILKHAEELASKNYQATMEAKKSEAEDQDEEGMVIEEEDEGQLQNEIDKKQLDLIYFYLRQVYSFCFYCILGCNSICDLTKKCPAGHLRRALPGSDADEETLQSFRSPDNRVEQWIRAWNEKFSLFINPEAADLKKFGGIPVSELVENEITTHVKQEDEQKYRCKVGTCTKLFKGEDFVRNHIIKKHPEFVTSVEEEGALLNSYVLDACRLLPARSDGFLQPASLDSASEESDAENPFSGSSLTSTFGGLPTSLPPSTLNAARISNGNGNNFHQADPFEASQTSSFTPSGQKGKRNSMTHSHNSNTPQGRNRDQEWRSGDRNRRRSRSPLPRDRGDYRDRRDYREDRRDRDYNRGRDHPQRGEIDRYRGRGERHDGDRPPLREDPRAGALGDPRGRSLRSYEDIAPETVELDY